MFAGVKSWGFISRFPLLAFPLFLLRVVVSFFLFFLFSSDGHDPLRVVIATKEQPVHITLLPSLPSPLVSHAQIQGI